MHDNDYNHGHASDELQKFIKLAKADGWIFRTIDTPIYREQWLAKGHHQIQEEGWKNSTTIRTPI